MARALAGAMTRICWRSCAGALVMLMASAPRDAAAQSWDLRTPVRGMTVGPIESALHPGKGYGSPACARSMRELARAGATWVSITPYGRVLDLAPSGIDWTFEALYPDNRRAVAAAVRQAHAEGLRVLLVPHLWVETGEWRGQIDPLTDTGWRQWAAGYRAFLLGWAQMAREAHVDLLSVGVELGSWVTGRRAPSFFPIIDEVRKVYPGPLTYSANWDDVEHTVIWRALDVVGVNAFYPLAARDNASFPELFEGGRRVAERVHALFAAWQKPVLFTELGYTTRQNPAVRPWEWPDAMKHVAIDEDAQADAYRGLLAPLFDEPAFMGFFVWRVYADPDDVSQEAEWGFSPRGKRAGVVLRDAYRTHWASDPPEVPGDVFTRWSAGADFTQVP